MTLDFISYITEKTENFTGREWVFEKVNNWLADPDGSSVFLLTGGPGTGKSAVAARLAQMSLGQVDVEQFPHLGKNSLSYYHFCRAKIDSTLDPLRFVEALSSALANRFKPFAEALLQVPQIQREITINQNVGTAETGSQITGMIIQSVHIGNLSARAAFDWAVRRPLELLCRSPFDETIFVLVDSMDEALTYNPEENIPQLVADATCSPENLPVKVRFLLTSRPDLRIISSLGKPALDLIDNKPSDTDDVYVYVKGQLGTVPTSEAVARRIADTGRGNFLYAHYVLKDLGGHPEKIADPTTLKLPDGLEDVYRQFIRRELDRNHEFWEERYRPILGILTVAHGHGLTRTQLAAIAGQFYGLLESRTIDALNRCVQYIVGPQPDGPFNIYHQSFREFLLTDERYKIFPTEANCAVVEFFITTYREDAWLDCQDYYALQYLVVHLYQLRKVKCYSKEIHTLLETRSFIDQNLKILGKPYLLLDDLRLALSLALENDDLAQAWRHIKEFRRVVREQIDLKQLLTAVESANKTGNYFHVIERTTLYSYMPNSQALARLWIAWNAAVSGHTVAAESIVKGTLERLPPRGTAQLATLLAGGSATQAVEDAISETLQRLLIRISLAAQNSVVSGSDWLRHAMDPWPMSTVDVTVGRISESLVSWGKIFGSEETSDTMEGLFQELQAIGGRINADKFIDRTIMYFFQMRLAAGLFNSRYDPAWLEHVKRSVALIGQDDYPSYREVALSWIAAATLAQEDTLLASKALAVVLGGMFKPSPGFWGDTVAAAMEGMERENNQRKDCKDLLNLLEHVEATGERGIDPTVPRKMPDIMRWRRSVGLPEDPWSFSMRRYSAVAAVLHRRGDDLDAYALVKKAIYEPHEGSYAGYRALSRLSLACRLLEWRCVPEAIKQTDCARNDADHVRDLVLRLERLDLVDNMCKWITDYGQNSNSLNEEEALTQLQRKTGLEKGLFIEFLSALWSDNASILKRLLPLALDDATTADAVLGRLLAVEALQAKPGRPFLELVKALQIDTGIENVQTVSKNGV